MADTTETATLHTVEVVRYDDPVIIATFTSQKTSWRPLRMGAVRVLLIQPDPFRRS